MKSSKFQEILSTEDFWWYLIAQMKAGQMDFSVTVLGYEKDHGKTGVPFKTVS